MIRWLKNFPGLNHAAVYTVRFLGLDNPWLRRRLYPAFMYERDGVRFLGSNMRGGVGLPTPFWDGLLGFEPEMSKLWWSDVRPESVVLDVGAYFGYYSLISARKGARVFAFEPSSATRKMLIAHLAMNSFDVAVIPVALSDHEGHEDLFLPRGDTDSGASLDGVHGGARERVRVTTMDKAVEFLGLDRVDVIKLDVERLEPQVLAGATETIRRFRPIIYCEVLPNIDTSALERALQGYQFQHLTHAGPVTVPHVVADPTRDLRNYRMVP